MKVKVLLADDETSFAGALKERLEIRGFNVFIADDGKKALECLHENKIDVAVLDVMMPELTGTEVLKEIRKTDPLVQVVLLTGHGTVKNAVEGMKLGAFDYLLKPVEIDSLCKKLNEAYKVKSDHEERIKKAEIDLVINKKGW
jgi:DNA-binding NtrC family response regulator